MRISVIIPVFNSSRFISSTLESVLIQDEVGEVILVDDASTDHSVSIIEEIARTDKRVVLIRLPENKGSGHARNVGIKHAKCELISFLDSDDLFLKNRFKEAIEYLDNNPEIDGTYEDVLNIKLEDFRPSYFDHQVVISTPHGLSPAELFDYIAAEKGDFFTIISLVIRKNKLNTLFDESFRTGQDIEFSYQIAKNLSLIHLKKEISIHRRLHGENITSSNFHKEFKDRFRLVSKWYEKIKNEPFSKKSARAIFIRYIHHIYTHNNWNKTHPLKWGIKAFYILREIIRTPSLIWKLI